jgi:HPt (histidine-containing phosphotransfer) domain-containing protein
MSCYHSIIYLALHGKKSKNYKTMNQQRHTNLEYLQEITGGEGEVMKEFIQMFFDQLIEFRTGMAKYLEAKKWKELGELAHKAKSSVMTFGMNDMGHRLKDLQLKTQKLEDIETYPEYVNDFLQLMDIAEKELNEDLKNL